jgi:AraC-like DNA-binding protein
MIVQGSADRPPRAHWSLAGRDDPHAVDFYRESLSGIYDSRPLVPTADFFQQTDAAFLGDTMFARVRSCLQANSRSNAAARRSGLDHVQLIFQMKGDYRFTSGDREAVCAPGSVRFVDLGRPFEAVQQAYDILDLIVPREALHGILADRDLHGLVLDGSQPATRLLTAHLGTLWHALDTLTVAEVRAGADAALALAGGAAGGQLRLDTPHRPSIERTPMQRARALVDARLADPALGPDMLGVYLGLSLRSLYRLVAKEGGVAAFIQGRRLDRAFRAVIAMRPGDGATLATIAYAHGFNADSHFSRAFKARFGVSPRDLRGAGQLAPRAPASGADAGIAQLLAWLYAI